MHIGTVATPVGPQKPDLLEMGYQIFTPSSFTKHCFFYCFFPLPYALNFLLYSFSFTPHSVSMLLWELIRKDHAKHNDYEQSAATHCK